MLPQNNRYILSKGAKQEADAYSGFQETPLLELLHEQGIQRVFIGGIATEYCVRATVIDALNSGFASMLLADAIQGVDANPGDMETAVEQMLAGGAVALTMEDFS